MGLFGKKKTSDNGEAAVIMTAMLRVIYADGEMDESEMDGILSITNQLKVFADFDTSELHVAILNLSGDELEVLMQKMTVADDATKQKAFIAACECAYISPNFSSDEEDAIEALQELLSLGDEFCSKVIDFCKIKYL